MNPIWIASDHAGFELKSLILKNLEGPFEDLGPFSSESVDYPDFAHLLCEKIVASFDKRFGILICGSGQGMAMSANRHPEIRAALCWNEEVAKLSRQHNDANVLCLGARVVDANLNLKIIKSFFEASFEGGRHQKRVDKI